MLFCSNTCLAPLLAISCSMANSRCCSSIFVALCILASRTASFSTLLAFSFSVRSVVCIGAPISSSLTLISSSVFTVCISSSRRLNRSITGPSLVRSMPNNRCSGPTERLANLAASSLENASISDNLGENCVVIYTLLLIICCKDTTILANTVP